MNLTEVHHKSPCSPGTGMKRISEKLIQGLEDSMILWWTSVKFITNWGSPADLDLWWTATSFIRNSSSWPLPVPWKSSHGFNRNRIICDECDASRNFGSKALQVPSFFLHFVRTRLGGWLQSFTVTVIRLTPVCAFSVLKSADFLCWKAQLKIALFSLLLLQNNWQAWLLTNYKETCQQYSWWKVGSHATYQTFFHPLSSLDPKKIHDRKIRIILLEVVIVNFTMMMFWLSLHAARTHAHTHIYIYIQTHLG